MVDRVNLEKSRLFVGVRVIGADGNLLFKEFPRLRPAFSLEGELFLVRLQQAVDGGRADGQQQFSDFRRYAKWRL